MVEALTQNEDRTFSQTEIFYFERWWNLQNDTVKAKVHQLVREGRFEFVNGGWVASDEACPTYEEFLLNMLLGHTFLNSTFGYVPKHAWSVDAFGHSSATPELLKRMGFESLFFSRVSTEERNFRKSNK